MAISKKDLFKTFTGAEFNAKFPNIVFVKLTNQTENHFNLQFKDGLIVDHNKFYPYEQCKPGGIYFCQYNQASHWIDYGQGTMQWVRRVLIPDDAKVYIEPDKFKANKIILLPKQPLWEDATICKALCEYTVAYFPYVTNQTPEICLIAVEKDPYLLRLIKNQTKEVCYAAAKKNPKLLSLSNYIRDDEMREKIRIKLAYNMPL